MKLRLVLTAAVSAIVATSCVAATEQVATQASSTTTELASIESAPPPEQVDCSNFLADGEDRSRRRGFKETRLTDDAQLLTEYGWSHPEAFSGIRLNHNPTRLEIAIKSDVEEHCLAMRELVKRKNGFDVVFAEFSLSDKQAAAAAAAAVGADAVVQDWGPIRVELPAFAESTAAQLNASYGDMFEIILGGRPYPPPESSVADMCRPVVESEELPPLEIAVTPPPGPVDISSGGEVTLVIKNSGTERGTLIWGAQVSSIFADDGADQPVTGYFGTIEWGASSTTLEPGGSVQTKAFIGLAPCTLDHGYVLMPGTYQLRGPIEVNWNDERYVMFHEPVPVTVQEVPPTSLAPKVPQSVTAPPTTTEGP